MSEALANNAWFYVDLLAIAKGHSECGLTARVQQSSPAPTSVLAVRAKSVAAESRACCLSLIEIKVEPRELIEC